MKFLPYRLEWLRDDLAAGDVRTTLEGAGVATHIGPEFTFHTLNSAIDALTSRTRE